MSLVLNNKPLILIAEDNDSNYLLYKYLLKNEYRLKHAHNGREAIEIFIATSPDLIIMDIKMPELNGYEATEAIRKLSVTVPIIAVTAYAFSEDKEKIMENGFDAYVSKPIDQQHLKTLIKSHLKQL